MYSEIVQEPQFYLDAPNGFYPEATSFIITGEYLEYLCAALHTKTVTCFFKTYYAGGGLGEKGYRYKKAFLENLPIVTIDETMNKMFISKINKIQKLASEHKSTLVLDNELNDMIVKLYNLSNDEINFIKSQ